ncbi:MAG: MmcQ/YjbR family DNA-binding protein [Nocardioidaceae bacterium]
MADVDDVRRIVSSLPRALEKPIYGTPGFRVADKAFARLRDDEVLVAWVESLADKESLIGSKPAVFFTEPHYDGHSSVLVQLSAIDIDELREVLTDAWRARAPKRVLRQWDDSTTLS